MMKTALVIPARYESGRLPGKPLLPILGIPMIERTFARCILGFPKEQVFVATDDVRIEDFCRSRGMPVLMTSRDCLTGTDRVAEAAEQLGADYVINVQGDEPILNPDDIKAIANAAEKFPDEVLNGYCAIDTEADFRNSSLPKVTFAPDGRLLYMSRAAIPSTKSLEFKAAWRQICIYGFSRAALQLFARQDRKTPLEAIEDIEILRFLELGIKVRMIEVSNHSFPVDVPEDVTKIESIIAKQ